MDHKPTATELQLLQKIIAMERTVKFRKKKKKEGKKTGCHSIW